MIDTIITEDCKTILNKGCVFCIEPTYWDDGEGGVILGQHQTKFNTRGRIVEYEHFDCEDEVAMNPQKTVDFPEKSDTITLSKQEVIDLLRNIECVKNKLKTLIK